MFEFLKEFPQNTEGLYIVYELFTFDNLFRLILAAGYNHDETMDFMISKCSFSAIVFQERIHNNKFYLLNVVDVLSPDEASVKAKFIADLIDI